MTPDTFATLSLSGPISAVVIIAAISGVLLGLGAGSVIGWLSGYAAGAFRVWRRIGDLPH